MSLVNHLVTSPSKEVEVGCKRMTYSSAFLICVCNLNSTQVSMSIFAVPVLNVLWEMVAGHSFKREDVEVQKILKMMNWVFTSKVDYQKDATIFTCRIFCHDKSFD